MREEHFLFHPPFQVRPVTLNLPFKKSGRPPCLFDSQVHVLYCR